MRTTHNDVFKEIIASSDGWDEGDTYGGIQFYDAILATDTKLFKKGSQIECICFSLNNAKCQLYEDNKMIEEFPIKMVMCYPY